MTKKNETPVQEEGLITPEETPEVRDSEELSEDDLDSINGGATVLNSQLSDVIVQ